MEHVPRNVFRVCNETTSVAPVRPVRNVEQSDFKIYHAGVLLRVCSGRITKDDLMKAAKCANLKNFKVYTQSSCAIEYQIVESNLPVCHNVYLTKAKDHTYGTKIFHVCESTSTAPVRNSAPVTTTQTSGFKIYHKSELMRICATQITKDDLMKAAKCAKLTDFKVYTSPSCASANLVKAEDLPIRHNVYIRAARKTKGTKTKIFHVCETTSVAPKRKPTTTPAPTPQVMTASYSAKKQLLDKAISCFESGITALKDLSRKL